MNNFDLKRALEMPVEAWLATHGVDFAPAQDIPLTSIDIRSSRDNQARETPLVNETVDSVVRAIKAGTELPPIVLCYKGAKFSIVDGNNRDEGHRRSGADSISAIVVSLSTSPDLIDLLTVQANATQGVRPPLDWRVHQAAYLISLGYTEQQASEAANVSVATVRRTRQNRQSSERARAIGCHAKFERLNKGVQAELGRLKDNSVFRAATDLVAASPVKEVDLKPIVSTALELGSEQERLSFIKETLKKEPTVPKGRSATATQNFITAVGKLLKVDVEALMKEATPGVARETVVQNVKDVRDKLDDIQVALDILALTGIDE